MTTFLAMAFIAVAILIVLVVLVQRGRGGGLAGAFGSGGGSSSAFGTKTGDVFTTATVVLFVVFMLLAIWLNFRFQTYKEQPAFGQATPAATSMPDMSGPATPPGGTTMTPPALGPTAPTTPTTPSTTQPK